MSASIVRSNILGGSLLGLNPIRVPIISFEAGGMCHRGELKYMIFEFPDVILSTNHFDKTCPLLCLVSIFSLKGFMFASKRNYLDGTREKRLTLTEVCRNERIIVPHRLSEGMKHHIFSRKTDFIEYKCLKYPKGHYLSTNLHRILVLPNSIRPFQIQKASFGPFSKVFG